MTVFKGIDSTSDLDYPTVDPTLDLNFALTKTLDPRITYSRNSTGTYVGSDGLIKTAVANEPRFEHDPVTGKCLGLLIEESRTNLLTNSEDFSTWTYSTPQFGTTRFLLNQNISTINSPDGLFTSDLLTETKQTVAGHYIKTLPISAGSYYCISCYVYGFGKYSSDSSTRRLIFGLHQTFTGTAVEGHTVAFNLGSTSVTSSRLGTPIWNGGTGISTVFTETGASIISIGNGWKRVSVYGKCSTANPLIILTTLNRELGSSNDNASGTPFTMSGDGFSGVSIWGVQGEAGPYPTSYIPTSGSTVTRAADSATISGTNFSSWYNTSEGTLLSVGEPISSNISSNTSLNIIPSSSSTRTVSNLLYYPKVIQYATLKSMNANGYSYPSPISTTGLLLNLDAGNTQSYSGSGSTWFDLSGNGRNFTLNNPSYYSFSSFNGGSIGFTRTLPPTAEIGGYAEHTASGNLAVGNYLYNDHTTEIWARINDRNPTNYAVSETQGALFVYVGHHSMFYYSSTDLGYNIWNSTSGQVSPPSLTLGTTGTDIIQGQWFHVVAVRNGNNLSSYINGNLKGTNIISPPTNTGQTTNIIRMGMAFDSTSQYSWHTNANVSAARMYNRALASTEVQQNFNALRGRYGI